MSPWEAILLVVLIFAQLVVLIFAQLMVMIFAQLSKIFARLTKVLIFAHN